MGTRKAGFTLVELLVVIAIIGILISFFCRRSSCPRVGPADAVPTTWLSWAWRYRVTRRRTRSCPPAWSIQPVRLSTARRVTT